MLSINELLTNNKQKTTKIEKKLAGERNFIIGELTDGINKCNVVDGYKKLSPARVSQLVSHLKENKDLYYLLSICKDPSNKFSKVFYGSMKPKLDKFKI